MSPVHKVPMVKAEPQQLFERLNVCDAALKTEPMDSCEESLDSDGGGSGGSAVESQTQSPPHLPSSMDLDEQTLNAAIALASLSQSSRQAAAAPPPSIAAGPPHATAAVPPRTAAAVVLPSVDSKPLLLNGGHRVTGSTAVAKAVRSQGALPPQRLVLGENSDQPNSTTNPAGTLVAASSANSPNVMLFLIKNGILCSIANTQATQSPATGPGATTASLPPKKMYRERQPFNSATTAAGTNVVSTHCITGTSGLAGSQSSSGGYCSHLSSNSSNSQSSQTTSSQLSTLAAVANMHLHGANTTLFSDSSQDSDDALMNGKRGRKVKYPRPDAGEYNPVKEFRNRQRKQHDEEDALLEALERHYNSTGMFTAKLEDLYFKHQLLEIVPERTEKRVKRKEAENIEEKKMRKRLQARRDSKNYREREKRRREFITKRIKLLQQLMPHATALVQSQRQMFKVSEGQALTSDASGVAPHQRIPAILRRRSNGGTDSVGGSRSCSPASQLSSIDESPYMPMPAIMNGSGSHTYSGMAANHQVVGPQHTVALPLVNGCGAN